MRRAITCNLVHNIRGFGLVFGLLSCSQLQKPYAPVADWTSTNLGCTTGLSLADINGDGFDDLIVAVGNDQQRGPLAVYENNRAGLFPHEPSYQSSTKEYYTNLAVGDINLDGWLDVAVSVGLGSDGSVGVGWVDIYFNHAGKLDSTPSFRTQTGTSSFACALGDVDGDGDLDLAATSMSLLTVPPSVSIYRNDEGKISQAATWVSQDQASAYAVQFSDTDQNGLLDLAITTNNARLYRAVWGAAGEILLPTSASWTSSNGSKGAFFIDSGLFGLPKQSGLVVSYNDLCYVYQTSCNQARYAAYHRNTAPGWNSASGTLGAGILLADVDADGKSDLLTGSWGVSQPNGAPVQIFRGVGNAFQSDPSYISRTTSVAETLAVADLDRKAIKLYREMFVIHAERAVLSLSQQVIDRIQSVRKNNRLLQLGEYISVPGRNWVSFKERLHPGDRVEVTYTFSKSLDLAVASCGSGNLLYYHRGAAHP